MARTDGVRALAREAGRRASTAGRRWNGAVGDPARGRAGTVGDAVRTGATRTAGAVRDARDGAVRRGAATRAGQKIGDAGGRVGRWAREMPLLSLPRAVVDERHGIATLSALVRDDPRDPVRAIQLAESLALLDRDLAVYLGARTVLAWNPLVPVVAEAAKMAAALGTGELTSPAEAMQRRAYALAVRRLRDDREDGIALHVVARVFAARGVPGPGLRPAHRAVARTTGPERGRALYTAARLHRMAGDDDSAGRVAAQAVRAGCSLGWLVLADLMFAADADGTAAERIAGYRDLRDRTTVDDEIAYRGVVRPPASDLWRAVLRDQTGKTAAGYRGVGSAGRRGLDGLEAWWRSHRPGASPSGDDADAMVASRAAPAGP